MSDRYDLIIVGMGSAGMVAAEFAARLGIRVAAVERDRVGGDCLWTGCVPSKALLAASRAAHAMRTADRFGIEAVEPVVDRARVWERVREVQHQIAATDDNPARFATAGIDLHRGSARLTSPTTVDVDGRLLEGRFILLCTGSRPAVPAVEGLAEAGYLTSETLWELERPPASVIAIGGGPVAVELSQAFVRLGIASTILERGSRILPRDEPELVDSLLAGLARDGVAIEPNATIGHVEQAGPGRKVLRGNRDGEERVWAAEEIVVATGREPNVEGLGLDELGIELTAAGVAVDRRERTAVKSIFAAGDISGGRLFTHSAGFEAARAVRNMFFPGSATADPVIPWCTFTDPELAHVGATAAEARVAYGENNVEIWRRPLARSDRARTERETDGAIVIVCAKGRVVGAHVLAPAAGELIGELALAVHKRLKLTDLAGVTHVYPTIALGIQQLAAEAAYATAEKYRWLVRSSA